MGKETGQVIFQSRKSIPADTPNEFATLESAYCNDDLAYAVPMGTSMAHTSSRVGFPLTKGASPALACRGQSLSSRQRHSRLQVGYVALTVGKVAPGPVRLCALPQGKRVLRFEGYLNQEYCQLMADTGATHTFASAQYIASLNMQYTTFHAEVYLSNDSSVAVLGYLDAMMKLGPLRRKHRLLVVDLPSIDVVLGLDFMTKYNMVLNCKESSLSFPTPAGSHCLRA
jgi:hypothetical protein